MSPERLPSKSPEGKKGNEPSKYVPLKEYRPEGFEEDMNKGAELSPKLKGMSKLLSGLKVEEAAAKKHVYENVIKDVNKAKPAPAAVDDSSSEAPKSPKFNVMASFLKGPDAGNVARGKEVAEKAVQEGKASVEKNPPNPLDDQFRKRPELPPSGGPTSAKLD